MSAVRPLGVPTAPTRYVEFDGQDAVIITRYSLLPYDPIDDDSDLRRTAMAIGGARWYGQVTRHNWERFARRAGTEIEPFLGRVAELATHLPDAVAAALSTLPPPSVQRDQLRVRFLDRLADHLAHTMKSLAQHSNRGTTRG